MAALSGMKIERMEYRVFRAGTPAEKAVFEEMKPTAKTPDGSAALPGGSPVMEARVRELESLLEEQQRSAAASAELIRREASERARLEAQNENALVQRNIAEKMGGAVERFHAHAEDYFAQVEHEVVRLALSIAARVLHRESQMDALLLSGAVRVALGQLADSTEVKLRVPAKDQKLWLEMIQLMPNLPLRPQLISDEALTTGECQIETRMGSIDLGVKAQLGEIERGFFDLLERRQQLQSSFAEKHSDDPTSRAGA